MVDSHLDLVAYAAVYHSAAGLRTHSRRLPTTNAGPNPGTHPRSLPPLFVCSCSLKGGIQPGPAVRQFVSPPSNLYAPSRPVVNNSMIIAGPAQAYNYHRAQFPQAQQVSGQLMPPPQPQLQQTFPQQGPPSVLQQQTLAVRPRAAIDLTISDHERVPKRPRMGSDPDVSTQHPAGLLDRPRYSAYAQVSFQTPYQTVQQRNPQSRAQIAPVDHAQNRAIQPYYPQRSVTAPNPYQHAQSPTSPRPGANSLPNTPTLPISAASVMDAYRAVADELGARRTNGQLPNSHGQIRGVSRPQQLDTGPAQPASAAPQNPSAANAGTHAATPVNPTSVETPAERSTGTPLTSTPTAPLPGSVPASPQVTSGQVQGGESSLPPLTEEQTEQMRSEVADSMFTEPKEGDETQARVCVLCE